MKKLIAASPILYMGRTYERGATLPAHDGVMVAAWLHTGAARMGDSQTGAAQGTKDAAHADHMAAEVLRNMGVILLDENGKFMGAENLIAQIRALTGSSQEPHQDGNENPDDDTGIEAQHLNAGDLLTLKKADLKQLAKDIGVDISKARNNNERAAIIATAQAKADRGGQ